jgi:hypothetical protein
MSKRVGKTGHVVLLSGIVGLMSSCGPAPAPTVNVKPIPSPIPASIAPTPLPGSSLLPILPAPGQTPLPGSSATPVPGTPIATPTPFTAPGQLAIATTTLPTAALNFTYTSALSAVGGSGSYRWNIASGSLPNGLILDQATGQIFGKPTQTGTFSFEIQAIDTAANAARRSMFILVSDTNSGINSVGILTTSLPSGTVDRRYSQPLNVGGGTPPYSWSISSGALPDGLEINSTTGEISGTPTLDSEETFTVKVVDARGQTATKTLSITINRTDSNISILTPALPVGIVNNTYVRTGCGTNFSGQLVATGGNSSYTWERTNGTLPPGLTLSSSGNLTGTPTATGSYTFTVRVSDSDDNRTSQVFTVDIRDLIIHRFSPDSGGENLRMVIEGENFGANADTYQVLFGGTLQTIISGVDTTTTPTCHRLTLPIPASAQTGILTLTNTSNNRTGSSNVPFIATDVVINEVFTNPDNSNNQFVELLNKGVSSASIAGWHLRYTDINGQLADFTIPPETPPLAPGAVTVININRDGGSTASNLFTGSGMSEMRFAPTAGSNNLTQLALCTDAACTVTATNTNFRDYLQFGPGILQDGGSLENDAVTSGIWTNDAVLDVTSLMGTLDTAAITAVNAHNGSNDGTANRGLLLTGTESGKFTSGDSVVVDNLAAGGKVNRLKRTVDSLNGNRVTIDQPLMTATISPSNTGNGAQSTNTTPGNGILVDKITDPFSALSVGDFVNVLAGGTIRTVAALQTTGPKIELDQVLDIPVLATNTSDGTASGSDPLPAIKGFEVSNSAVVAGAPTVSITIGRGTIDEFTVVRNIVSVPDATHVILDSPLAVAPVVDTNTGDGTPGNGIVVSGLANFITGRTARIFGQNRVVTISGSNTVELDRPIASMQIDPANTGTGSGGSEILVNSTTGFEEKNNSDDENNSRVRINGLSRVIQKILNNPLRVQLDQPISMTVASNDGDGTVGNGIRMASIQGFVAGNQIRISGQSRTISAINGSLVELSTPISTTVDGTNSGDGTTTGGAITVADASSFTNNDSIRFPTINGGTTLRITARSGNNLTLERALLSSTVSNSGSTNTTIQVNTTSGLEAGFTVRFSSTGETGIIQSLTNNSVTLTAPLAVIPTSGTMTLVPRNIQANFVPETGTVVLQGNGNALDFIDVMNLVPDSSQFTLVPVNPLEDFMSRIPTTGTILLAPSTGTVKKFRSIKYDGSGNNTTDLSIGSAPTAGSR